jgi:hypothetical protein
MKRLAHNSKTLHGSPRSARLRPAPNPNPASRPRSHRFPPSILTPHARALPPPLLCRLPSTSTLSLAPFNLHMARVHRASGFLLTAFSNARPQSSVLLHSTHQGRASEKALASLGSNRRVGAGVDGERPTSQGKSLDDIGPRASPAPIVSWRRAEGSPKLDNKGTHAVIPNCDRRICDRRTFSHPFDRSLHAGHGAPLDERHVRFPTKMPRQTSFRKPNATGTVVERATVRRILNEGCCQVR